MSYVIYVDEMIVWNTIINLAVITISSIVLRENIKYFRIFSYSFITALVTTIEYILTLGVNIYIHHISYAGIYLIMIGIYFKNKNDILKNSLISLLIMILIYGGLGIFFFEHISTTIKGILIIFIFVIISIRLLLYSRLFISAKENIYKLNLTINHQKINLMGFMDTGNSLNDPYTGLPVIVMDYRVLKKHMSPKAYEYILNYHKTGAFDYACMKEESDMDFYPIPYKTISTGFALMPAFKATSLVFTDFNYSVEKIVCGIGRFKLKNNNEYQVLLSESLKPNRKEKFK